MICLREQGDEYARTGDIRVLFGTSRAHVVENRKVD